MTDLELCVQHGIEESFRHWFMGVLAREVLRMSTKGASDDSVKIGDARDRIAGIRAGLEASSFGAHENVRRTMLRVCDDTCAFLEPRLDPPGTSLVHFSRILQACETQLVTRARERMDELRSRLFQVADDIEVRTAMEVDELVAKMRAANIEAASTEPPPDVSPATALEASLVELSDVAEVSPDIAFTNRALQMQADIDAADARRLSELKAAGLVE